MMFLSSLLLICCSSFFFFLFISRSRFLRFALSQHVKQVKASSYNNELLCECVCVCLCVYLAGSCMVAAGLRKKCVCVYVLAAVVWNLLFFENGAGHTVYVCESAE